MSRADEIVAFLVPFLEWKEAVRIFPRLNRRTQNEFRHYNSTSLTAFTLTATDISINIATNIQRLFQTTECGTMKHRVRFLDLTLSPCNPQRNALLSCLSLFTSCSCSSLHTTTHCFTSTVCAIRIRGVTDILGAPPSATTVSEDDADLGWCHKNDRLTSRIAALTHELFIDHKGLKFRAASEPKLQGSLLRPLLNPAYARMQDMNWLKATDWSYLFRWFPCLGALDLQLSIGGKAGTIVCFMPPIPLEGEKNADCPQLQTLKLRNINSVNCCFCDLTGKFEHLSTVKMSFDEVFLQALPLRALFRSQKVRDESADSSASESLKYVAGPSKLKKLCLGVQQDDLVSQSNAALLLIRLLESDEEGLWCRWTFPALTTLQAPSFDTLSVEMLPFSFPNLRRLLCVCGGENTANRFRLLVSRLPSLTSLEVYAQWDLPRFAAAIEDHPYLKLYRHVLEVGDLICACSCRQEAKVPFFGLNKK